MVSATMDVVKVFPGAVAVVDRFQVVSESSFQRGSAVVKFHFTNV